MVNSEIGTRIVIVAYEEFIDLFHVRVEDLNFNDETVYKIPGLFLPNLIGAMGEDDPHSMIGMTYELLAPQ